MAKKLTVLIVSATSIIVNHLNNRRNKTFTVTNKYCGDNRDFPDLIAYFKELKRSGNLGAVVITPFLTMQDIPAGMELMRLISHENVVDAVPLIASCTNETVLRDMLNVGCTHTHHERGWTDPEGIEDVIEAALIAARPVSKKS